MKRQFKVEIYNRDVVIEELGKEKEIKFNMSKNKLDLCKLLWDE